MTIYRHVKLSRISEDILEQVIQDETELQIHFASRVYLSKSTALCVAYRKYCNGLKKADCVLVCFFFIRHHETNSKDFNRFF